MRKSHTKGYINGIIAAISYGLWLKIFKKISFKISFKEFICLLVMAILFAFSSVSLFESFKYLASDIACTILFVYPIMVALISAIFFKEKLIKSSILAMIIGKDLVQNYQK